MKIGLRHKLFIKNTTPPDLDKFNIQGYQFDIRSTWYPFSSPDEIEIDFLPGIRYDMYKQIRVTEESKTLLKQTEQSHSRALSTDTELKRITTMKHQFGVRLTYSSGQKVDTEHFFQGKAEVDARNFLILVNSYLGASDRPQIKQIVNTFDGILRIFPTVDIKTGIEAKTVFEKDLFTTSYMIDLEDKLNLIPKIVTHLGGLLSDKQQQQFGKLVNKVDSMVPDDISVGEKATVRIKIDGVRKSIG